jgi:hypothetical protein
MKHAATLDQLGRYVLRPSQWDAQAEAWSRFLPSDCPGDSVAWFRSQVTSGAAKCCKLLRDGEPIGFVVFRVEPDNELLLMGAFGRDGENLLTDVLAHYFESIARAAECTSMRLHTMRPGLIAAAQKHGFRVSEVICRKHL